MGRGRGQGGEIGVERTLRRKEIKRVREQYDRKTNHLGRGGGRDRGGAGNREDRKPRLETESKLFDFV